MEDINLYCNKLDISNQTKSDAIELFKIILKRDLMKGRSVNVLIITSIYISCQFHQEPISLAILAKKSKIPKKKISQQYRAIIKEFEIKIPPPDLYKFLRFFIDKMKLGDIIYKKGKILLDEVLKNKIDQGKDPSSIIGAIIYITSKICGKKCTQQIISKRLKITETTIRNRFREIIKKINIEIKKI